MPHDFSHTKYHDKFDTENTLRKEMFDRLHKRKIAMSDLVFVVNPAGYIGESTRSEIEFAKSLHIDIVFMHKEGS
jgi:hypothetical protein